MDEYEKILSALNRFESTAWVNHYFNLVKKLLSDLNLKNDDPRLVLSLPSNNRMPVIIGQRYVLEPYGEEGILCTVLSNFNEKEIHGEAISTFSKNEIKDMKYVQYPFP